MGKTVKWLALGIAGALAFVVKFLPGKRGAKSPDAMTLLRYLATHTSSPIPEIARQAKMSTEDAVRLLVTLEEQGLVKLSEDKGLANVRIAAITKAGREQVA
jgi:DNA-binding MarR family transcriptional regulator